MKVTIQTVKHEEQRYDTVGDYQTLPDGSINFTISEMGDWRYEALVAVHELVEKFITKKQGVSEMSIDYFDIGYEAARGEGDVSEPGNHPTAPYHEAHVIATSIEMELAKALGVSWADYDKKVSEL